MRIRGAEVVLGFAVLGGLMGCSSPPGVVSKEVYDLVNENTRERNYDLAWQEIRALKGSLERGDTRHLSREAMVILSRMERLEVGKASPLSGLVSELTVPSEPSGVGEMTENELVMQVSTQAQFLQEHFDRGDFAAARDTALRVYSLSLQLSQRD